MLIHTQRVPYKGRTAEQDAVSYPESHTRARLPSRTLIHTQRVPQRAGLPRRMLFHTQRVPYKGRTDEQDADTYPESPTQGPDCRAGCCFIPRVPYKGQTAEQDAVSYPALRACLHRWLTELTPNSNTQHNAAVLCIC